MIDICTRARLSNGVASSPILYLAVRVRFFLGVRVAFLVRTSLGLLEIRAKYGIRECAKKKVLLLPTKAGEELCHSVSTTRWFTCFVLAFWQCLPRASGARGPISVANISVAYSGVESKTCTLSIELYMALQRLCRASLLFPPGALYNGWWLFEGAAPRAAARRSRPVVPTAGAFGGVFSRFNHFLLTILYIRV